MGDPGTNGAGEASPALTAAQRAQAYRDHVALARTDALGRLRLGVVAQRLSEEESVAGWLQAVREVATEKGVMISTTRPRRKR